MDAAVFEEVSGGAEGFPRLPPLKDYAQASQGAEIATEANALAAGDDDAAVGQAGEGAAGDQAVEQFSDDAAGAEIKGETFQAHMADILERCRGSRAYRSRWWPGSGRLRGR